MGYENISQAAFHGDLPAMREFLRNGATLNDTDENGQDVVHSVIDSLNFEAFEFVLNAGVDVNHIDATGWTPLMGAINAECDAAQQLDLGSPSLVFVEALLRHGANPRLQDWEGRDAFTFARIYANDRLMNMLKEAVKKLKRKK